MQRSEVDLTRSLYAMPTLNEKPSTDVSLGIAFLFNAHCDCSIDIIDIYRVKKTFPVNKHNSFFYEQ